MSVTWLGGSYLMTLSGRPKATLPGATSVVAVSGMVEPKLMRTAPRSYSLSVDLRVSNVPRQDLPISDCWALNVVAIRHAALKAQTIARVFFMPSTPVAAG